MDKIKKPSNTYFSKLLVYSSLIVVTVILIISAFLYFYFEKIQLSKTHSHSKDSISQISYTADSMLENVKTAIGQIISDPKLRDMLYETNSMEPDEIVTISERLSLFGSVPFLQSVYLYNGKLNQIIGYPGGTFNRASFHDQDIIKVLDSFNPDNNIEPISRKVRLLGQNVDYYVYTFVYYERSGPSEGSAVILNVSDSWLRNAINRLDKQRNGSVVIVDANGAVVSSAYKDNMLKNVSRQDYVKRVIESRDDSGYFTSGVDGIRSVVTYASSPTLGWKYIRYTPYETISRELNRLRLITSGICFAILLVGLLLSYVVSRKLHLPVLNLLKQLDTQKRQIMSNSHQIKQEFLRKLLYMDEPASVQSASRRFHEYAVRLDPEEGIRVMLLKIDHYEDFMAKFSYTDRDLLRFGMMNIASEILLPHVVCERIDLQGDHIAVVLNATVGSPPIEELHGWAKDMQCQMEKYLKLSITVAVTNTGTLASLKALYEEAQEIAKYRIFYGWGAFISCGSVADRFESPFDYSTQLEESLVDNLMLGKIHESKQACKSILDITVNHSYKAFEISMMRMFFAIHMAVDTMEKASGYPFGIHVNEELHQLTKQETMKGVHDVFMKLLDRIDRKLEEKKNAKYDNLMQKIDGLIRTNYMKEELCLDWIADSLGMSPMYLSRLIKKYMAKSITDYINEVRIEHASELLVTTDLLITDISQRCGFSGNSYFGKLFKKERGVTPNEYRKRGRTG